MHDTPCSVCRVSEPRPKISMLVRELLAQGGWTATSLARRLGVEASTVSRWAAGSAIPRPRVEGELRAMAAPKEAAGFGEASEPIRLAIDGVLISVREALHRRGKLSSRNEALDEIAKLLFAHVVLQVGGEDGISSSRLEGEDSPAKAMKSLVLRAVRDHLPESLAHELSTNDFQLRLKDTEDALALEIADAFGHLPPSPGDQLTGSAVQVDLLNEVFGKFLADSFHDDKELGQYLTPPEVVELMVGLALDAMDTEEHRLLTEPGRSAEFGVILDPSCGTASFLTEVVRQLLQGVATADQPLAARVWLHDMVQGVLVGIDKSERMIRLALANLAMFGWPAARLHAANALSRSGIDGEVTEGLEERAGLILTNPPFGAEFSGRDLSGYRLATKWSRKVPRKIDSELLFMERYLSWLRPGGQCLAIVPDSVLTNRGLYEDLRRGLAASIKLENVISLPPVTFAGAGTSTKTSVLHFRKTVDGRRRETRTYFAISKDIGYTVTVRGAQRRKRGNGTSDLQRIRNDAHQAGDDMKLGRVVAGVESSSRWDATFHASLPPEVEDRLRKSGANDVRVKHVAELVNERVDPRRWPTDQFPYIEISDVDHLSGQVSSKLVSGPDAPSRARKGVRAGDVLVSTVRPERRTIGIVPRDLDGAVCSTGFAVLRPRGIDSRLLAFLLKQDFPTAQILRNNIGIAYPAIDEACLAEVVLPATRNDIQSLAASGAEVAEFESRLSAARAEFSERIGEVVTRWAGPTPAPKRRLSSRTKSRRRPDKQGSDARSPGALTLWEGRTASRHEEQSAQKQSH